MSRLAGRASVAERSTGRGSRPNALSIAPISDASIEAAVCKPRARVISLSTVPPLKPFLVISGLKSIPITFMPIIIAVISLIIGTQQENAVLKNSLFHTGESLKSALPTASPLKMIILTSRTAAAILYFLRIRLRSSLSGFTGTDTG